MWHGVGVVVAMRTNAQLTSALHIEMSGPVRGLNIRRQADDGPLVWSLSGPNSKDQKRPNLRQKVVST